MDVKTYLKQRGPTILFTILMGIGIFTGSWNNVLGALWDINPFDQWLLVITLGLALLSAHLDAKPLTRAEDK